MEKQINLEEILFNTKYKPLTEEEKDLVRMGIILFTVEEILLAMKKACELTVNLCNENADLDYVEYEWQIPEGVISTGDNEYGYRYISKNSILNTKSQIV